LRWQSRFSIADQPSVVRDPLFEPADLGSLGRRSMVVDTEELRR
jgi:hypothetical protein